jgi:hypothetical protein
MKENKTSILESMEELIMKSKGIAFSLSPKNLSMIVICNKVVIARRYSKLKDFSHLQ